MAIQKASRTHRIIQAVFKNMVRHMDANKINIAGIASQAGICRKTFYSYYSCREDIFIELCDEIVDRYTNAIVSVLHQKSAHDLYRSTNSIFFEFFTKQDLYVEQIICNPTYNVYRERIIKGVAKAHRSRQNIFTIMNPVEKKLFQDYGSTNLFTIYTNWVKMGKTVPVEELSKFAYMIVYYGMSCWIEPHKLPDRSAENNRHRPAET